MDTEATPSKTQKQKRSPESPFLDEELFSGAESETGGITVSGIPSDRLESPFQHAFEQKRSIKPAAEHFAEEHHVQNQSDREFLSDEEYDEDETVAEYEFVDEWDDGILNEFEGAEFGDGLEGEEYTESLADREHGFAEGALLGVPVSGILGETILPEQREITELEQAIFEAQVQKEKPRRECKHYPSTLNITRWRRRTASNAQARTAEFRRLRETKNLTIAVLSRARIRLPLNRVEWLLDMVGASHWVKHLTTDLSGLVNQVNVTIELHKVLAPVQERDIRLLFENRAYRIHSTELRRCRFYVGWYKSIDGKETLEKNLGINLNKMFTRSRVPFPATRRNATEYLLVAYASFPSWLEDKIRRKLGSINSDAHVVSGLPPWLKVTRLGRSRIELPIENVRWMLKESQRKKRTGWTRRLKVELLDLMAVARKSLVTIDLLRIEGPITGLQMLSGETVAQFAPYVQRLNEPYADDWPFNVFQILPLSAKSELEQDLQLDLEQLLALPSGGVPTGELALLVSAAFPTLIEHLVISPNKARIAGFEFGKHRLTQNVKKEISLVGRHIADSWRVSPWYAFRPVRKIEIIGYTDSVGTEESNLNLGLARAREAEKWLKKEIRRHWGAMFEPTVRIRFTPPSSKGEADLRLPDDAKTGNPVNRRVEINLDAPEPEGILKHLRERLNQLLDDPAAAGYPITADTTKKLKCMIEKLERSDVDDRYIAPIDVLNQDFTPDILQSARDFLMSLTYQVQTPEPRSDRELLKALRNFNTAIYDVRSTLQNNANIKGAAEDPDNTAKRRWLRERTDSGNPKGEKSIQSCFPPLNS